MNNNQASYLFLLVAVLSFLVVLATLFFAATDSKNTLGFLAIAVVFALTGTFWAYRFVKGRRAS